MLGRPPSPRRTRNRAKEKHVQNIGDQIKEIISQNGQQYLTEKTHAYAVYLTLLNDERIDAQKAAAVLLTLLSGIPAYALSGADHAGLVKKIQTQCFFTKRIAEEIAAMYEQLFSKENRKEWDGKSLQGYKEFLSREWPVDWYGEATWDDGPGFVECSYKARFVIRPAKNFANDALRAQLKTNPFLSAEDIFEDFQHDLLGHLNSEFSWYCSDDDYYPPVVEDFDFKHELKEWCRENAFEIVNISESSGETGDFEPKNPKRRW